MNFKKWVIGLALLGTISAVNCSLCKAIKSSLPNSFSHATNSSEKTSHKRKYPITYDEISDQSHQEDFKVTESDGPCVLTPDERMQKGQKLYELALASTEERQAFIHFKNAAWEGNVDALVATGRCYEDKKGISRDLFKALRYFEKAKEKGNACAQEDIDRVKRKLLFAEGEVVIRLPESSCGRDKGSASGLLADFYIHNYRVSINLEDFNIHIEEVDTSVYN